MAIGRLSPFVLISSMLFIFAGVFYYLTGFPLYWKDRVIVDFMGWGGLCCLIACLLKRNDSMQARSLFMYAVLLYLAIGVGIAESAATALFIVSSLWYGRGLLSLIFRNNSVNFGATRPILIGIALQLAFFGALIHFPFNYRGLYLAVLLAPVIILFLSRRIVESWNRLVKEVDTRTDAVMRIPYWYFVLMVILIGWTARFAFFPTIGYDDNAQHLRMWTQLTFRHIYSFDAITQIWEVAPFAVSILHSIVSLVAGVDSRGALNLVLLALLFRQIWAIITRFSLEHSDRLLVVLLFASTPMVGNLLVSLQTELFLALLVTSGARLVLESHEGFYSSNALVVMAVAAMCCAAKLPGALLGSLLVTTFSIKAYCLHKESKLPFFFGSRLAVFLFFCLLVFVAFNSYLAAWLATGNPLFPLYNGIFKSSYFGAYNFSDTRWVRGFNFKSYWEVFFKTSEHYESEDFVAGFQYLFLLPVALIAMLRRAPRLNTLSLLVPLLGFGIVMFSITQYWRYVFPVFPLATAVIGGLFVWASDRKRRLVRGAIMACIALNFYFYPGISWLFNAAPQSAYTESGRQTLTEKFAPAKAVTTQLNERISEGRVLYPGESPFGATLRGDPIYVNWYSPAHSAHMAAMKRDEDVASFLKDERVGFVIWNMRSLSKPEDPKWLLREYLSHAGLPEFQVGNYVVYRVIGHDLSYRKVFNLEDVLQMNPLEVGGTSLEHRKEAYVTKGVLAGPTPHVLARLQLGGASIARYHVNFSCREASGYFIAQVNWNIGTPYYRRVPCGEGMVSFTESVPVPAGATNAEIYATVGDTTEALVSKLTLETN